MIKTINQIKKDFEDYSNIHEQLKTFGYGQEFEQIGKENIIYPLMWVVPVSANLNDTTLSRVFRVIIADRVRKGEQNELEVESDTQLICLDTLAYWTRMGENQGFEVGTSVSLTPFWEKWTDEVTGHFIDISIDEFYDYNSCSIPIDGSIPSGATCKPARITINDLFFGNAPSDELFNIIVKNEDGLEVGQIVDGEWIVPNGGGGVTLNLSINSDFFKTLSTNYNLGIVNSNDDEVGTLDEPNNKVNIANSTIDINKSDGSPITQRSILAEATENYNVADSVITLNNTVPTLISTTNVKATDTATIVAPDATVTVNGDASFPTIPSGGSENIGVENTNGAPVGAFDSNTNSWVIGDATFNLDNTSGATLFLGSIAAGDNETIIAPDGDIENSDATYTASVESGGVLVLPDQTIEVNTVNEGSIPSVGTIEIDITDGTNPVTPDDVTISGRTITIEVPTGGTPMIADFEADILTAFTGEDITFTDLSDQSPTHWSWRFSDGTTSIVQNPVKNFLSTGLKSITLLAGKIGAGGVNIKNNYIEILANYLSNIFGNPAAGYSLRKLTPNSVYSGAAIRVRRSSDNTEQDIDFVSSLANAIIDTTALLTFVGAGDGFVTVFYNQNGSGEDLTQTTASNQPRIVLSGVVDTLNGLPSLVFDGTNDFMSGGNILSIGTGNDMQSHATASISDNNSLYAKTVAAGETNRYALIAESSFTVGLIHDNVSPAINQNTSIGILYANQRLFNQQFIRNTSNKLFVNNSNVSTYVGPVGEVGTRSTRFLLGAFSNATDTAEVLYLNGKVQELVMYIQPTLPNISNVNTNINSYYNVF